MQTYGNNQCAASNRSDTRKRLTRSLKQNKENCIKENGCKWRALLEQLGKWYTAYARFRRR